MNQVTILPATTDDAPLIRNMAMATWPVAYSRILTAGQVGYMLNTLYSEEVLQQQIRSGEQQYLIARQHEAAIGFAAFGSQEAPGTYKLFKLYILPEVQKTGAGKALLEEVAQRSRSAGGTRLILNVHRRNPARHYYEKAGFRIYQALDIPFGPGFVLNDYLMEKPL